MIIQLPANGQQQQSLGVFSLKIWRRGRIRGYYEHLDSEAMQRLRRDIQALAGSFQ